MKDSLKLKLRKMKMNDKARSLHYTIIDSENNVTEAEFDDEYKVLFKEETYDSNNPNKQIICKILEEDTSNFMFVPQGTYFILRYLYDDKQPNYVTEITTMGLYKAKKVFETTVVFGGFDSCEYKIRTGDIVKCSNWEMKINSFSDMRILMDQLRTEYQLIDV